MSEVKNSIRECERFTLNFKLPFSEAIENLRSSSNGKMRVGSHVYHVLAALFNGHVIDDYGNPPTNYDGAGIRNVAQRVWELQNKWGIDINCRYKARKKQHGKATVEYFIARGGVYEYV